MDDDRFRVLFICTGNRFRSAIAEALLAARTRALPVEVSSAGMLDLGPVEVLPEAAELASELDIDLAAHRARCVRDVDLLETDLVLGFERVHVATAVVESGAPRERAFTLPELVELLDADAPSGDGVVEAAREAVRLAHERRRAGRHLEVGDPLGGTPEIFRSTALEVRLLVDRLAASLFAA